MSNFNKTLEKALNAIGVVVYNQRTIDLLKGHRGNITTMVRQFAKQEDMTFIGMPHQSRSVRDFGLDVPNAEMWKATNNADWKFVPDGLGTFNNVFPESATSLRWNSDPAHWAYVPSLIELGSANNMWRVDFKNINGVGYGIASIWHQSRLPALKIYQMNPAVRIRENGTIGIDMEFDGTAEAEVVTMGSHLLPHEILVATDLSDFVEAIGIPAFPPS